MAGPQISLQVYDGEEMLLQGLRRGDPDACTCLMKQFSSLVYARALRMTGDHDEAENVLQTTFINACEAMPRFDGTSRLGTWLYRIATNEALMLLRKRRPTVGLDAVTEGLSADEHPHLAADDPFHMAVHGELRTRIEQAIAELPESLRSVVMLRDILELSTEEAAQQLGIAPGTVKVRLHRARGRLREILTGYMKQDAEDLFAQ
ncbi:sigma-70 family RNA polymerase sigma factor [Candidatus Chloroploca sp. M-50]|uniref:Sigma-70 family RNA polymerase sigma factor n=1 Tax=Candidatus Chloroploca mongolica TaxID=2528176 RepID=A0ABS4D850_9CHLR|nr:sigma-70 family RNA polymerase sigma factor [Candidatus Chloroploca mongolica]MBP1465617.1 sigma-70 family RNA polymerase sigma factor [Candidatus Chloroploca mongolica]